MKGIAHFTSGVALASFLPAVVRSSAEGTFVLLAAGIGAVMPDLLDFRVARYLYSPDVDIDPDPISPDPQRIAQQLAEAVNHTAFTYLPVRVRLHPMRLAVDQWRRYSVRWTGGEMRVRIGPLIDASEAIYPEPDAEMREGRSAIAVPVRPGWGAEVAIGTFDGSALEFRWRDDGVEALLLPWHRQWSHSVAVGMLVAAGLSLLLGPLSGVVFALGWVTHVLEDQLGHLGCNLVYPITHSRLKGLGLFHSGEVLPNVFAVWLSGVLIMFNLDRFSPNPVLDPWLLWVVGLVLPWMFVLALSWWTHRQQPSPQVPDGAVQLAEGRAEAEQIDC